MQTLLYQKVIYVSGEICHRRRKTIESWTWCRTFTECEALKAVTLLCFFLIMRMRSRSVAAPPTHPITASNSTTLGSGGSRSVLNIPSELKLHYSDVVNVAEKLSRLFSRTHTYNVHKRHKTLTNTQQVRCQPIPPPPPHQPHLASSGRGSSGRGHTAHCCRGKLLKEM